MTKRIIPSKKKVNIKKRNNYNYNKNRSKILRRGKERNAIKRKQTRTLSLFSKIKDIDDDFCIMNADKNINDALASFLLKPGFTRFTEIDNLDCFDNENVPEAYINIIKKK